EVELRDPVGLERDVVPERVLPADLPGAHAVPPGAERWEGVAAVLLCEDGHALEPRDVVRGHHDACEPPVRGVLDPTGEERRALRPARDSVPAAGAGEDGGEAIVADLHELLQMRGRMGRIERRE